MVPAIFVHHPARAASLAVLVSATACAPAAPATDGKETTVEVGLLEAMVTGHFDTFVAVEDLATSNGIDLESDRPADWPRSGDATVNFGQSTINSVFTVDRDDYTRTSRTWSVALALIPMQAAGQDTTGDMTGTWEYWEEGGEGLEGEELEEADITGWVLIDLAGMVASDDEPASAVTSVYAVINDEGFVYEAEVIHGDQTWAVTP